jgi:hypothetical protein
MAHNAETTVNHSQVSVRLTAYDDFFTLWKDADPDVPILKQAKAEYAKRMIPLPGFWWQRQKCLI